MILNEKLTLADLPEELKTALGRILICELEEAVRRTRLAPEEIRIRRGSPVEFVFFGKSVCGVHNVTGEEIDGIFFRLCGGSVYAHAENICRGFIDAKGIRVGVCGTAVTEGGRVRAVHDISSVNIRLPCKNLPDVSVIAESFIESYGGMLIFSPPGEGKTTVLRSMIKEVSGKRGLRACVIDTRGELFLSREKLRTDFLSGYPKGLGIEIAVRSLNPRVIFCDEIGSRDEADAILAARDCGVPVIATAHGDSAGELVKRQGIAELFRAGIFKHYVRLHRDGASCRFDITEAKELARYAE